MKKYTIIEVYTHKSPKHFDNFDDVLSESEKLSKNEVYHIIKDNKFGTSVKMCECCKKYKFSAY